MQRFGEWLGLDRALVGHALRLALAAWLAFAVASVLHIQNAYWAAMPIWVVAQPSRGLLLERAVFRITGTLGGAVVGFGILHLEVSPYLQLAALAIWVALNAGLTRMLRGVHYYGALLSGITAAIVVITAVFSPESSLDLAVARVECTLIGVVMVTLVTGLLTPKSPRGELYQRVRQLAGDAVAHAARLARGGVDEHEQSPSAERRILAEISDVENTARLVSAGSIEGYRQLRHVDALVVASLSVLASGVALRGRHRRGEQLPPELPDTLDVLAARLRAGTPREGRNEWLERLVASDDPVLQRLARALELLVETEAALSATPHRALARSFGSKAELLAPQQEWTQARRIGLVAGVATFVTSAASFASGLPDATLAAMGVSIFTMVLGSMPQPHKIAPKLLTGILVGVAVATGYRLWLQPAITTTTELVLSIGPFVLLGGFARASRRTAIPAIDANMGFLMAGQAVLPAITDRAAIFTSSAALVASALMVAPAFMFARPSGGRALEAASLIRRDLRRLLEQKRAPNPVEWQAQTSRQILRLTLHLGRAGQLQRRFPGGLVASLDLGHTIFSLRALGSGADSVQRAFAALDAFDADPRGTAATLRALAIESEDLAVSRTLLDVADALEGSADFLSFCPPGG